VLLSRCPTVGVGMWTRTGQTKEASGRVRPSVCSSTVVVLFQKKCPRIPWSWRMMRPWLMRRRRRGVSWRRHAAFSRTGNSITRPAQDGSSVRAEARLMCGRRQERWRCSATLWPRSLDYTVQRCYGGRGQLIAM
jgi:hypothetical protein